MPGRLQSELARHDGQGDMGRVGRGVRDGLEGRPQLDVGRDDPAGVEVPVGFVGGWPP